MDIVTTCPNTGRKAHCREIRIDDDDGKPKLHQCDSYMQVGGINPQTGENVDDWRCTSVWSVMLQIESTRTVNGVSAAVVSLREETIKRQDSLLDIALTNKPQLIYQDDGSRQQPMFIEVN